MDASAPYFGFYVEFTDGSVIEEYINGVHVSAWPSVEEKLATGIPVSRMVLMPLRKNYGRLAVVTAKDATPVFFRRYSVPIGGWGPLGQVVTGIGYKKGDDYSLLFAFNDGSIILTDDYQGV